MRDPDPDPTEQELAAEVDLPLPAGPGAEDRLIPYFRHEPWIMGILNVTPDSFSDGGRWDTADAAVARGLLLAEQGAHLVDVGGESTRPGAHRVTAQEEAARVEPVIAALSQAGVQCSIDTTRATVAQAALDAGAVLVNDVSGGLADPEMRHLVADRGCPWILMHWRGHSDVMDQLSTYGDVVADVRAELSHQVELALAAGIDERSLIVDPGLGFAKTAEHNWELLRRLPELVELGLPVLIGASRKRFLGSLLATGESDQLELGIQRPPFDPGGEPRPAAEREHATAAIVNGMALSKVRPFWSGFMIFSDYARGALRLSALMELPVLHILTHDSIGVGEDGPTHQPVEQLVSLRAVPGLLVFRPADANEVVETWRIVTALRREPAALVLSRQALPTFDRSVYAPASGVARGAYVLAEADGGMPGAILLATGSEVQLALSAREQLQAGGIPTRVVSMPCWELFDRQPAQYRDSVIPRSVRARVSIEQASTLGWDRYVGDGGAVIGMHTFGASAPLKNLLTKFGFTPDAVVEVVRNCIAAERESAASGRL